MGSAEKVNLNWSHQCSHQPHNKKPAATKRQALRHRDDDTFYKFGSAQLLLKNSNSLSPFSHLTSGFSENITSFDAIQQVLKRI
ncbi:MAG: hypothetical protein WBA57_14505 [Elainellaceae cyanobacterium]